MFILEVQLTISHLGELVQLAKVVHVKLPHERLEFVVTEKVRKHRSLESPDVFNDYFCACWSPTDDAVQLVFLDRSKLYL